MVFHLRISHVLGGGDQGVDVFFVLSGFLITSLLISEWEGPKGRISLPNFYARRALRLFPALGCVIVVAVSMALIFGGAAGRSTLYGLPWVIFYVGNWARAFNYGTLGSLGHTWSLAVEEQFYLIWPGLFVLLSRRRFRREHLALSLALMALACVVYRQAVFDAGWPDSRVYYATDTRCAGLLAGCAVAFWLTPGKARHAVRTLARKSTWVGAAVLTALLFFGYSSPWPAGLNYPLVLLASVVLLVGLVVEAPITLERLLSSKMAVWIGRRSYGLYLWHYVIYAAIPWPATRAPIVIDAAMVGASFVVAALSYDLVELPALRLKRRFRG
jgi:peptidoglycan/LPS O-acetylase OafA/YrhL